MTSTRDGADGPVPGNPTPLSSAALVERFRRLPSVDPQRLQSDIDALIDQRL